MSMHPQRWPQPRAPQPHHSPVVHKVTEAPIRSARPGDTWVLVRDGGWGQREPVTGMEFTVACPRDRGSVLQLHRPTGDTKSALSGSPSL